MWVIRDMFKKVLLYIRKHLSSFIVLVITIIVDVYLNVNSKIELSLAENVFLAGLIGLNISFLCDFIKNMDSIDDKIDRLSKTFPDTLIETYPTVDLVADELKLMVSTGTHQVDIVLYDTEVRTRDPNKVSKMKEFMEYCSEKPRIKLRLAFVPSKDSICHRIDNIIASENKHSESYYAYQESSITFASFMIIDNEYVSIRTPHKNGSTSMYCVVREKDLCTLYSSWFSILWDEATHINKAGLNDFIEKYSHLIPEEKKEEIKKKL